MTRIDVEHRPRSGAPWWTWVLVVVLIILMAFAAWYFLSERQRASLLPDGSRTGAEVMRVEAAPGGSVIVRSFAGTTHLATLRACGRK